MVPEAPSLGDKLRFDVYEADSRSGELRKLGVRIPLEDRPFRALLILVRRANEVVTREELQKQLWPSDIFIDFEHGLNTAIRKIRLALNDRADKPRFIETVGRRGYRFLARVEQENRVVPEPKVAPTAAAGTERIVGPDGAQNEADVTRIAVEPASSSSSSRDKKTHFGRRGRVLTIAAGAMVLILAYLFRPAMPLPRISRIVQLTKSGGASLREPLFTDGPRVYYRSVGENAEEGSIRQVLLNGNEDTPVAIPAGRFVIRALSRDDTDFLVIANEEQPTIWTVPVAGGSPRRIGNLVASDIAWSHDGNWFAYALGNQLFLANADGTSSHPLATVTAGSAVISHMRWSPDDRRLRFTLSAAGAGGTLVAPTTRALWEVGMDGRNLHPLHFPWPGKEMECCGDWTPDGRYFVFRSQREDISNLWALEEKSDWWRRANRDPVQLTSGPMNYYQPVSSRNGKSIFAIGSQPSGELVRYDMDRKEFVPYLGGRSFDRLAFTPDGQWLAYVEYPEGTLWRARSDGTEQLQLTFPPLQAGSPRWSADGKRIAFHASQPGKLWKSFVISAEGGNPEPLPSEPFTEASPDWMPADGDSLIYGRAYLAENPGLYTLDLRSGRSEKIPGTDGLFGPIWSPDGRHLSVVDPVTDYLFLLDLKTGKRTQIAGPARWPFWSPDSRYIYFKRDRSNWIWRVRVPEGREEKFLELPFRLTSGAFSLAPDGSPIMLREHGRYDVYSLSLSVP
jgi:Tol biopolymer transport system component/DNA-binding winged helix-turn-helix (wHTH) protein